jgi:enoyl-CoA hydratase/carnithine racemase
MSQGISASTGVPTYPQLLLAQRWQLAWPGRPVAGYPSLATVRLLPETLGMHATIFLRSPPVAPGKIEGDLVTTLDEYSGKYRNAALERRSGVLQVTLHDGQGGALKWSASAHTELSWLFRDIAGDIENRVVILAAAGGHFINGTDPEGFPLDPVTGSDRIYQEGKDLLFSLLDIKVPVIAAISGNAFPHAEIALMSDIVIAGEDTVIRDVHFDRGLPPSDGVHVTWTMLLGMNRGRYYLLTGKEITASQALEWGLVAEVLAPGSVLGRAWELAERLAAAPRLTLRYTREAMTLELKRRFYAELGYGLALESMPSGFGTRPAL